MVEQELQRLQQALCSISNETLWSPMAYNFLDRRCPMEYK